MTMQKTTQKKTAKTAYQRIKEALYRVNPEHARWLLADIRKAKEMAESAPVSKRVSDLVRKHQSASAIAVLLGKKAEDGSFLAASLTYGGARALDEFVGGFVKTAKKKTSWSFVDSSAAEETDDANPFAVLKGLVK